MTHVVVLDSGPLGLLTAPPRRPDARACATWLASLLRSRHRVIVPEIADYELPRELLRASKYASITRLDALAQATEYLALTTDAMRKAAELWAQTRQQGQPTAAADSIDADMILAAQALNLALPNVVVATTNVGHLSRVVSAANWQSITP